jgi:hypothetical protein
MKMKGTAEIAATIQAEAIIRNARLLLHVE